MRSRSKELEEVKGDGNDVNTVLLHESFKKKLNKKNLVSSYKLDFYSLFKPCFSGFLSTVQIESVQSLFISEHNKYTKRPRTLTPIILENTMANTGCMHPLITAQNTPTTK